MFFGLEYYTKGAFTPNPVCALRCGFHTGNGMFTLLYIESLMWWNKCLWKPYGKTQCERSFGWFLQCALPEPDMSPCSADMVCTINGKREYSQLLNTIGNCLWQKSYRVDRPSNKQAHIHPWCPICIWDETWLQKVWRAVYMVDINKNIVFPQNCLKLVETWLGCIKNW
jgi:hypothetical protein